MSYSQRNTGYYDNYNGSSESGCILSIIIFGSLILFLLVVILITICWICCRKDNRRDGIVIHPMTQPHHGGVMYTQGPNCQHVQYQQHQPPAQVHVNAQRMSTAQPGNRNDVSECRNTAPQNTCLPLE
ncbi:uncharacterized protein LOC132755972 isoform X1 [Ruditapes philippinarum]|uniref:uncharacterized protein LOC132755972 isoform X1 n=1 Tax=Ruditapes philippinarum TaxID=129788 RepID=UPI00295BE923|nr:uncharacterized protein LOC132755972 isoform X1 [Ruditapes philippinarum]